MKLLAPIINDEDVVNKKYVDITADKLQSQVDNIQIGGRNLFLHTKEYDGTRYTGWVSLQPTTSRAIAPYTYIDGFGVQRISRAWFDLSQEVPIETGTNYTLSAWVKWESEVGSLSFYAGEGTDGSPYISQDVSEQVGVDMFKRVSCTYNSGTSTLSTCRFECNTDTPYLIYGLKFEKGNKTTDWTPAPEDIDNNIAAAINGIEIGGRNLLYYSRFDKKYPNAWAYSAAVTYTFDGNAATLTKAETTSRQFTAQASVSNGVVAANPNLLPENGCTYTISCEVMKAEGYYVGGGTTVTVRYKYTDGTVKDFVIDVLEASETAWTKYSSTYTYASDKTVRYTQFIIALGIKACGIKIKNVKFEKGNKPTDWTPAPEDIDAAIGNGTVTIKQAGTSKGTFTMNQSRNTTIELNDTTYGAATSSALGLVKSGTDITVDSSGNVSVNDNSHNHTISNITNLQSALNSKLNTSLKGVSNGLAELDSNGKVPSAQLPSYVDDIIEGYFSNNKFYSDSSLKNEITGENGKIYINLLNNKTYRWSGTTYVVISETLALGEASSTAYRGDRGKIAYDHSQSTHARTDATNTAKSNTNGNIKINGTETSVYTLPTASSTLGGVKTTSTVTSNTGYIATPIINGVPYYKDTKYSLPIASDNKLGGIKVGTNFLISSDGTLSSNWGNTYITNADEAPLGFSRISNDGTNNPFMFWVTLLTMGESETSGYKQQWAFPWGYAEAITQAPKYRVKDNGNWGEWTSLKNGGNADTVGGIAVTKLKGNDTKFIYTSQNGLNEHNLTEFKEEGHYFVFNYNDSPTNFGFLDISVFDGSGFTPMPNGIIRQSWTDFVDPSKNYMRIYNSTSATEGSWTDWKRISDSGSGSDTKVTNTLNTTTKAYITGTTSATTNTGTQIFDTGVYLDTTAGMLTANTFKGVHQYNGASTAWSYNNINSNFEKGNLPASTASPYYWDLNFTDKNGAGHANRIGYIETGIYPDGRSKISLQICENKKSNTNFHSISITTKEQTDGTFKETVQLGSKTLGATNKPIYLSNGVITEGSACLPLTGGNMTGNINIKSNTDNGVTLGRHIASGSSDVSYGYIHLYNSGSIAGDIFGKLNTLNRKRGIVIRPQDSGEGSIGDSSHYFGSAYINNLDKVTMIKSSGDVYHKAERTDLTFKDSNGDTQHEDIRFGISAAGNRGIWDRRSNSWLTYFVTGSNDPITKGAFATQEGKITGTSGEVTKNVPFTAGRNFMYIYTSRIPRLSNKIKLVHNATGTIASDSYFTFGYRVIDAPVGKYVELKVKYIGSTLPPNLSWEYIVFFCTL